MTLCLENGSRDSTVTIKFYVLYRVLNLNFQENATMARSKCVTLCNTIRTFARMAFQKSISSIPHSSCCLAGICFHFNDVNLKHSSKLKMTVLKHTNRTDGVVLFTNLVQSMICEFKKKL